MLLKDQIEETGRFLFRWRGYLPLFFLALVVATIYLEKKTLFFSTEHDLTWSYSCLFIGSIGILIRIMAVSYVPYNTSGRGTDKPYAEKLNTTGLYSIVRNPVYLGNFFTFLSPVLFAQSFWLFLLYLPVFMLYHERIIAAEEKFLLGKFKDDYLDWVRKTPVFIPQFSAWKPPDRPFNWKMAYKRESISFFTLVATIWGLEVFADYLRYHDIVFDFSWLILLVASAFMYLLNCFLVKFTKLLHF